MTVAITGSYRLVTPSSVARARL